mmetsp:Transcript_6365/g.15486  ORF Transcript_6365/g.15486 Transcript_6365/m.15486 type:complete len:104 (-) Transcript_6365:88-399(-)
MLKRPRAQLADKICRNALATTTPCYDLLALALALDGTPEGCAQPLPPPQPAGGGGAGGAAGGAAGKGRGENLEVLNRFRTHAPQPFETEHFRRRVERLLLGRS